MSRAAVEPPSTGPGWTARRGLAASLLAAGLVACLASAAPAGEVSPPPPSPRVPSGSAAPAPQPPAVGAAAPDFPLADPQNKATTLQQIARDTIVVLVFYIGYT